MEKQIVGDRRDAAMGAILRYLGLYLVTISANECLDGSCTELAHIYPDQEDRAVMDGAAAVDTITTVFQETS
jgi:hypothetical protein